MTYGRLYICATPIGNLEDITLRVLRTLKEVDLIAAEDTRQTLKLLNHYQIEKKLVSYHEHNKQKAGPVLIQQILEGKNIALVSDAGLPGISDPGSDLVCLALENKIHIELLPGPSASLAALILSGLNTDRFCFEGFLPKDNKERKERFRTLLAENRTMIFYESPHRVLTTLKEMKEMWGERKIALARELTKKFEEVIRGCNSDIIEKLETREIKGEIVLLVEGTKVELSDGVSHISQAIELYESLVKAGLDKKNAIKEAAKAHNIPKRDLYNLLIKEEPNE